MARWSNEPSFGDAILLMTVEALFVAGGIVGGCLWAITFFGERV